MAKRKTQSDDVDNLLELIESCTLMIRELELAVSQSERTPQLRDINELDELGKSIAHCEIFLERLPNGKSKELREVSVMELEELVERVGERYRALFLAYCQRLKVDAKITVSEGSATEAVEACYRPGSIEVFDNLRAAILIRAEEQYEWSDYYTMSELARNATPKVCDATMRKRVKQYVEMGKARRDPKAPQRGQVALREDAARELKIPLKRN